MPTSSINSMTKNSLMRRDAVPDAMTEIAVRNVVRMTRKTLRPSTPR